ncbi:hypothetical protein OG320_03585 [Microbispora sp. NBC_01189]|uniref:hypothetical protein n=1 Tax=Microbispora sp. NBC_01189 TaxID=2903583 RepID=UPI002E0D75AD|nr:hypothetical protein OG320_03585 [Microbispora sp. NBC_01189]
MMLHAARNALARVAPRRCAALSAFTIAVAVAAVLGAGPPSAAYAVPVSDGGGGGFVGPDNNGNGSSIRVGNGRTVGNYLAVGSLKSANGLQQATIGVNGAVNAQGNFCRWQSSFCKVNQNAWVSRHKGRW